MKLKTLYKKTATGAIQIWYQELNSTKNGYCTVSGQKGSNALVRSAWTYPEPKNIGKKNETTIEEQVLREVEANYTKKLAQGNYHEELDDVNEDKYVKPMLALNYKDQKNIFNGQTLFVQPKLDGVRCIATAAGLFSRNGKKITSCPHIEAAVKPYTDMGLVLDGELYTHKLKDDFNSIISAVRKVNPTKESAKIEYWIYDVVDKHPFSTRYFSLGLVKEPLVLVPTYTVVNEEDVLNKFQEFIQEGYEGAMIRLDKPYENKRSKNLLKYKEFVDEEFKVVDIEEGVGNRGGMAGRVVCQTKNGKLFGAGIRGNIAYFTKILRNKFSYKTATVRFFALTPDGVPRFPVVVTLYEGVRDL